jgi:group II intron reverse transcriptase/maturase
MDAINSQMLFKNDQIQSVLAEQNMLNAWEKVYANKGSPGLDGVTLNRWARNRDVNIARIQTQVMENRYIPTLPKRIQVNKIGGGIREISMLSVTDKVLQRAVMNQIEEDFDRRFLHCSHGYRKNRSTATAIQQVLSYRDNGFRYVFDADILACFDNLDHDILMTRVARVIKDWFILNLMCLWLRSGRKHKRQAVGVPIGAVLSPLWCNIYLHLLDARLSVDGWKTIRYADDFVVFCRTAEETVQVKLLVENVLNDLRLKLSEKKTRLSGFDEGFTFLGVQFKGDTYSYLCKQKKIEVNGRNPHLLFHHPPTFYD